MNKVAFLFPGQGSQRSEMGFDLIEESGAAKARFEEAEAILGWSVSELCQPDNNKKLNNTLYTQPALYTVGCVFAERIQEEGVSPALVAGHSAGEYAALTTAGLWDFATGLRVIAERARLMSTVDTPGSMAAVLGLDPDTIADICSASPAGLVQIANYNSPKQTVISGETSAVETIGPILKEAGARRVVPLPVSGAFHSPLMKSAQETFAEFMKTIEVNELACGFVSNNTGNQETDPLTIRDHLVRQFCECVRWIDCMKTIADLCPVAIESGPGSVLTGLAKQCTPDLPCFETDTLDGIREGCSHAVD